MSLCEISSKSIFIKEYTKIWSKLYIISTWNPVYYFALNYNYNFPTIKKTITFPDLIFLQETSSMSVADLKLIVSGEDFTPPSRIFAKSDKKTSFSILDFISMEEFRSFFEEIPLRHMYEYTPPKFTFLPIVFKENYLPSFTN